MHPPELTLILPAYNEAKEILRTLRESIHYFEKRKISFEILVSIDGTDGTRELVQEFALKDTRVKALADPHRRGKGHGVRRAVHVALGRYIGFADADNKIPISDLDRFLPLLREGAPLVMGCRRMKGTVIEKTQPLHRRVGSLSLRYLLALLTGLWDVPDTQCGFKFFDHATAKRLFAIQQIDGYLFDVEILLLARRLKIPIRQVSIRWRDDGDSRFVLLVGSLRLIRELAQITYSVKRIARA